VTFNSSLSAVHHRVKKFFLSLKYNAASIPIRVEIRVFCFSLLIVSSFLFFFWGGGHQQVNTAPGNSGSAIEDAVTGWAIGIHTHGGCDLGPAWTPENWNTGTAISHPLLQKALRSPKGVCAHRK